MRTSWLFLIVVVLGLGVGLAATNPTSLDYEVFLERYLALAVEQAGSEDSKNDLLRDIVQSQGKQLIRSMILPNTVRRNYGLASVFTTTILDVQVVVVGAGRTLVPVSGLDELEAKAKRLGRLSSQ